ncbi:MAG: xylulokinase [Acutalibacter sp.]|jgi:sugar (pentulose or hexulose) kinase
MNSAEIKEALEQGEAVLGLELGSTRIKAVLIGPDFTPIASGAFDWENQRVDGVWSYPLELAWQGIQTAYAEMKAEVAEKYGVTLRRLGGLGFSAMMHGYLPFDKEGNQLCEFRTWRNTITEEEAAQLTELFGFNIPQRWSIAHLYRAIRRKEAHVPQIGMLTTLAGYVHWKLTGRSVLGVGEASGVFPIDSSATGYNTAMVEQFDQLVEGEHLPWKLLDILPQVIPAGADAGDLTPEGALLLDPTGDLEPGAPICAPEGDAGTGMVATNSVRVRTGNVSAGTSMFAMIVLEKPLSQVYPEIDMVTTPDGKPVAMVHVNTCTSDLDAWVKLFGQVLEAAGVQISKPQLYDLLYFKALEGDPDCGGLVSYNCYAGEPVTGLEEGRPLLMRRPEDKLTLGNFARAQLYAAMATLQIGMEILWKENVQVEKLYGHGGLFKTKGVGQKLLAGALGVPVAVMETAGEGGPWGMALLAAYRKSHSDGESLADFLENRVFAGASGDCVEPDPTDHEGFAQYIQRYRAGLAAEKAAVEALS